ncbi:MAG: type I restriction enzyme HsdR N-terminal domain-containing protein [Betaproteobacteria bacterium]|nr:type I restriction enzyme HsdR N-terminal domain-containing protein [Betaproteobacteria bacterium]
MAVPKRAVDRIAQSFKKYQTILAEAKDRDISESDTVVIIVDMLADLLGYRKYTEITTEFAIRGTYVDLAVKVDNELRFLIEAKAIGVSLKDNHLKQAVDYAANQGIEWVVLTNGVTWKMYKVHFKQPIDHSLVFDLDMLQASPKDPKVIECLGNLSREGFTRSSMTAYFQQQQITSKFSLAAILMSQSMLGALRRELRRLDPGIRIDESSLRVVLENEVFKREVVIGEEAKQAYDFLRRCAKAAMKAKSKGTQSGALEPEVEPASVLVDPPDDPAGASSPSE